MAVNSANEVKKYVAALDRDNAAEYNLRREILVGARTATINVDER